MCLCILEGNTLNRVDTAREYRWDSSISENTKAVFDSTHALFCQWSLKVLEVVLEVAFVSVNCFIVYWVKKDFNKNKYLNFVSKNNVTRKISEIIFFFWYLLVFRATCAMFFYYLYFTLNGRNSISINLNHQCDNTGQGDPRWPINLPQAMK